MIDVKQAVQNAKAFAIEVGASRDDALPRVEEVMRVTDEGEPSVWRITLGWPETSYKEAGRKKGILADFGGLDNSVSLEALPRYYKLFDVDIESGEVISMTLR